MTYTRFSAIQPGKWRAFSSKVAFATITRTASGEMHVRATRDMTLRELSALSAFMQDKRPPVHCSNGKLP